MKPEWETCTDIDIMWQMLVNAKLINVKFWRQFHCRCYYRVWSFIKDQEVRDAIDFAAAYEDGAGDEQLLSAYYARMASKVDLTWQQLLCDLQKGNPAEHIWPLSDSTDSMWVEYLSGECGKLVTEREISLNVLPDGASSIRAWATARNSLPSSQRFTLEAVERRRQEIFEEEESHQAILLRDMVADWFGESFAK